MATKARNRFKIPSSAVSMPSLTLDETVEEEGGGQAAAAAPTGSERTPGLEKSASSASIIRTRDGHVVRLGKK